VSSNRDSGVLSEQTPEGFTVRLGDRYLYSPRTPLSGAEKKAGQLPLADGCLYILPSPLLYYGVSSLIHRLPPSSRIITVELEPELAEFTRRFLHAGDLPEPLKQLPLYTSAAELERFFQDLASEGFRRCEILSLTGGYSLRAPEYRKLRDYAEYLFQTYWKNRATLIHMGRLWIRNLFENLPGLPVSVPLPVRQTRLPVLVAGAGESLEGSLDEIERLRGDIFLLAADTALPVLLARNLLPDAVTALEAQHANLYDFLCLEGRKIPLYCDLTSSPALLHRYPGPVSFFLSRFAPSALLRRLTAAFPLLPLIPPLGSVGVAALHLAGTLGNGRVLFTGLDFSFRPGKSHARSSPALVRRDLAGCRLSGTEDFSHGFDSPLKKVSGKNGRTVLTTPNLLEYAGLVRALGAGSPLGDLGEQGLPLEIPRFAGLSEALEASPAVLPSPAEAGHSSPAKMDYRTREVEAFLNHEEGILADLLQEGYLWLKGSRGPEREERLRRLLGETDYLTLSFPDPLPPEELPESYLKRALTNGAWFQKRLERRKGSV